MKKQCVNIKMAKQEGGRNASFLYARGGWLSNPFTPPRYIEGRCWQCQ
nr:MAG TPA: hypothetical protein [Caudoviricetes sp.]